MGVGKCSSLRNKDVKAVEILQEGCSTRTGKFGVGVGAARKCELYQGNPVIEDVIKVTADGIRLAVRPESLTGAYDHIEKIVKVEKVIPGVSVLGFKLPLNLLNNSRYRALEL